MSFPLYPNDQKTQARNSTKELATGCSENVVVEGTVNSSHPTLPPSPKAERLVEDAVSDGSDSPSVWRAARSMHRYESRHNRGDKTSDEIMHSDGPPTKSTSDVFIEEPQEETATAVMSEIAQGDTSRNVISQDTDANDQ